MIGGRRLAVLALAAAAALAGPGRAGAEAPAFAIEGWRHEAGARGIQFYLCQTGCPPGAKVSYQVYAPTPGYDLATFRAEQAQIVAALQASAPAGTTIRIASASEGRAGPVRRMMAQRVMTAAGKPTVHTVSGLLIGERATVSLISSGPTAKAARGQFDQFSAPLVILLSGPGG